MIIELRIKDALINESLVRYLIVDEGFAYDKVTQFFSHPSFTPDMIPNEYRVGDLKDKGRRWIWIDHDVVEIDLMLEIRELCK